MEALIFIGVLYAMFIGLPNLFDWLKDRDRTARRQLRAYEEWMDETNALAIDAEGVDAFAQLVAMRVRNFRKEQRSISK